MFGDPGRKEIFYNKALDEIGDRLQKILSVLNKRGHDEKAGKRSHTQMFKLF